MTHLIAARLALSMLCLVQAAATVALDLNPTHATHPGWMRHARFHVVWQTAEVTLLNLLAVGLLWVPALASTQSFYLAVVLAALSPVGFLVALATKTAFNGALSDPGGIPPLLWRRRGATVPIDMNLVAVVAALLTLGVIVAMYRW